MRSLRDFVNEDLLWVGEAIFRPRFHLKAAGHVLGNLRWERAFRSSASAEASDGRWQFRRVGYLPSRFAVRLTETGIDVARLDVAFAATRGALRFAGVTRYIWDGKTWGRGWQWTTPERTPLVRLQTTIGRAEPVCARILPEAIGSPDLSLLVLLQWYVIFELGILAPVGF